MKKEQRMDQIKNLFGTRRPNYSGLNGKDLKLLETKGLYPAQAAMTAPKPMIILCFGDDEHRNLARLIEKTGLTSVKLVAAMEGDQRL